MSEKSPENQNDEADDQSPGEDSDPRRRSENERKDKTFEGRGTEVRK